MPMPRWIARNTGRQQPVSEFPASQPKNRDGGPDHVQITERRTAEPRNGTLRLD
jgi:hypothetical protein